MGAMGDVMMKELPAEDLVDDSALHMRDGGEDDADHEVDDLAESKPRKKRKMIQKGDKKYHCPNEECGKSYSRAEHLYRHQLNHAPKQIYRCDFPGCDRHFVRADLCARHRERHTAKGSHLQRKDAFRGVDGSIELDPASHTSSTTAADPAPMVPSNGVQHATFPPASTSMVSQPYHTNGDHFHNHNVSDVKAMHIDHGLPLDPQLSSNNSYAYTETNGLHAPSMGPPPTSPTRVRRFSYDSNYSRPQSLTPGLGPSQNTLHNTMQPPPPITSPMSAGPMYTQHTYPSPSQNYRTPSNFASMPSLPPFGFASNQYSAPGSGRSNSIMSGSMDQHPTPSSRTNSMHDFNVIDQMTAGYAMPVFGADIFNRSPTLAVLDDNWLNSLFDPNNIPMLVPSPPGPEPTHNPKVFNVDLPKLEPDGTPRPEEKPLLGTPHNSPPTSDGLDIDMRESRISQNKKRRLADLVSSWPEMKDNPGRRSRGDILMGDSNDPTHVLSLHMLKTYIASYWTHIHQQMPILHRPTYNPETCPDLLLLAMMCIGATCLERTHPIEVTQNCAELSFFIAYHIRWEVFKDAEFRPTAKLWTFQTMLLLELFEKMYSTRTLHERAHIHHATTLTVMRRGSSLIGRSATESMEDSDDPTRTPPGPDGSINTSGQNTPDAFWNRWITAEATRRVAFAAFVIDSTHATLFSHSAVMSPHDLKLPLPCDEALWSATSSAEVQRVEASLSANGFQPATFMDGLKRTLNGKQVRTNTFGRVILMAGLLNISWHMNQRDLQVSSLGAGNTLGNQIRWRTPLTRAFDSWRRDFDESLGKNARWLQVCNPAANDRNSIDHRDNVFESRTCLHTLAHMAMHVDIIDCCVFAGSDRVVGRSVTEGDRIAVAKRMREQWAPSARARDATFYALRFLCDVLIPSEELSSVRARPDQPPTFTYSARDDYLFNRPWILYYALLIVWSYGYALDGPTRPSNYTLTTRELQIFDMQRYLIRMGGVATPDDFEKLKDRNSCLGLLLLLRESFAQPRWELLADAKDVLGSCIDLLLPGRSELAGKHLHGV